MKSFHGAGRELFGLTPYYLTNEFGSLFIHFEEIPTVITYKQNSFVLQTKSFVLLTTFFVILTTLLVCYDGCNFFVVDEWFFSNKIRVYPILQPEFRQRSNIGHVNARTGPSDRAWAYVEHGYGMALSSLLGPWALHGHEHGHERRQMGQTMSDQG